MKLVEMKPKSDPFLDTGDIEVLKQFYLNKHQSMSQMLTGVSVGGSKTIDSLQKLVEFGFVRRDWEKELKFNMDVIYCITREGKEGVEQTRE